MRFLIPSCNTQPPTHAYTFSAEKKNTMGGGRRGKSLLCQRTEIRRIRTGEEKESGTFLSPPPPLRIFEAERRATASGHCRRVFLLLFFVFFFLKKKKAEKDQNRLRKSQRRPLPPHHPPSPPPPSTHSPKCAALPRSGAGRGGGCGVSVSPPGWMGPNAAPFPSSSSVPFSVKQPRFHAR